MSFEFDALAKKLGIATVPTNDPRETVEMVHDPDQDVYIEQQPQQTALVPSTGGRALAPVTPSTIGPTDRVADEEADYNKVRDNYTDIAKVGHQALNDLIRLATMTAEPRAYEVVATLIKSLNETNKNLYGIHEESKRSKVAAIRPAVGQADGSLPANGNNISIDKAVFVGSQTELLQKLKYDKKEETSVVSLEPNKENNNDDSNIEPTDTATTE